MISALKELVELVASETSAMTMADADEDSVGWDSEGPLPMTFGHVRRAVAELTALEAKASCSNNHFMGIDDEDRTPMPDGYDAVQWQKADEVHHAMALVADDTVCVKILYAALSEVVG